MKTKKKRNELNLQFILFSIKLFKKKNRNIYIYTYTYILN